MAQSKKFTWNNDDLKSIGVGAGIAVTGAVLTYAADVVGNFDFGQWTPLVVALFSVLANAVRKWLAGK